VLQNNHRCILITGDKDPTYPSPDVLQVDYVPYSWLFNRSALIIHHGGAGTTARGLLAGVPNIILPFTSDQPFWGRQVHALGVGPKPIPANKVSNQVLQSALDQALNDPEMKDNAIRIRDLLKKEDGPTQALRIIEDYLGQ
jgi:UDP:flavonoid glycosyltransferase YjiC (YdhE family)